MTERQRLNLSHTPDHDYPRLEPEERDPSIERARARFSADAPVAGEGNLDAQRREVRLTAADLAKSVAGLQELFDIVMSPNRRFTHGESWGDATSLHAAQQRLKQIITDVEAFIDEIDRS